MDKKSKIALYLIGAIILLMMLAEISKPKALSWRDSYSANDKIPLGCYVMYNELDTFTDDEILNTSESLYNYLKTIDTTQKSTLVMINGFIRLTEQDSDALIKYVEQGNTAFISSKGFYGKITDTLNLGISSLYNSLYKNPTRNTFASPSLQKNNRLFKDVIENSNITSLDTLNTKILGFVSNEDKSETHPNFIKTSFGNNGGAFYIHTNPYAFTNYHLLEDKEDYTATVLSYLPRQQIIWDNYYKSGRKVITSPLRYILANSALKWAFYISLFTLILFILFKGKRTQRIIPVIEKLENSTVEFTRTVGELYYQHGDYTNIITKKIQYFLEHIRTKYYLDISQLNMVFIDKLAIKSGNSKEDSKAIIDFLVYLRSKPIHTENDLIDLNKKIEQFIKKDI